MPLMVAGLNLDFCRACTAESVMCWTAMITSMSETVPLALNVAFM